MSGPEKRSSESASDFGGGFANVLRGMTIALVLAVRTNGNTNFPLGWFIRRPSSALP